MANQPSKTTHIGERRSWSGNCVEAVAEIPGWVFVTPTWPSPPGRPFSISAATWVDLPLVKEPRNV